MKRIYCKSNGSFTLPFDVDYPVTIKQPFVTSRITVNKEGIRCTQNWYKQKRQIDDDHIIINGETYKVIEEHKGK